MDPALAREGDRASVLPETSEVLLDAAPAAESWLPQSSYFVVLR